MKVETIELTCKRCGHHWTPRQSEIRICPKCKSSRVQCYDFPTHSMECLNCYAIWKEMYMLVGYHELKVKEEKINE